MLNKQKLITSLLVTSLTLTTGLTTSLTHADSQLSAIVQKDYQKKFNKYLIKKDFDKLAKLLQKWEKKENQWTAMSLLVKKNHKMLI